LPSGADQTEELSAATQTMAAGSEPSNQLAHSVERSFSGKRLRRISSDWLVWGKPAKHSGSPRALPQADPAEVPTVLSLRLEGHPIYNFPHDAANHLN